MFTAGTDEYILFSLPEKKELYFSNQPQSIFLLNSSCKFNLFEYIPRHFTVNTSNGSYLFNIELLKSTSSVIRNLLKSNPNQLQYHLKIKDENKYMKKLEELYCGEIINLKLSQISLFKQVTNELNVTNSIVPLKPQFSNSKPSVKHDEYINIQLVFSKFHNYLKNVYPKTFTIATKRKIYMCNPIGIHSSKLIHEFLSKNPFLDRFDFDFDDELDEFLPICDFFNFYSVKLTVDNINSIRKIAEKLQIDSIMENINNFIKEKEKLIQILNDQQPIIDIIDELFEILFNIKKNSVELAKEKIINSNWIKTEEDVQELAAFIWKAIQTDFSLHPYLADLIEMLDKEADDSNQLKILLPFIINKLMDQFCESNQISSFIFILHEKGFIKKEQIKNKISKAIFYYHNNVKYNLLNDSYVFFIPELYEILNSNINELFKFFTQNVIQFIKSYFPEKIESFIKMRKNRVPDDPLTVALRNDDIDTFQSIVTNCKDGLKDSNCVPYNLFESFVSNGSTNYINYSAAYGSVRCFKYLLLNHMNLNTSSFSYAVFGGNIEIIKIIDQKTSENLVPNQDSHYINMILPSIEMHKNDLFDWILEHKFPKLNDNEKIAYSLISYSSKNGNSHAIMEIVSKGFDFANFDVSMCSTVIQNASKNGFYKMLNLLMAIMNQKLIQLNDNLDHIFTSQSFVFFGNLNIFKLHYEKMKTYNLNETLLFSVKHSFKSIIDYIFNNNLEEIKSNKDLINQIFSFFINENNSIPSYLIDNLLKIDLPNSIYIQYLIDFCFLANVENSKKITELILSQIENGDSLDLNFTLPFINAASSGSAELCQFFIDKKVYINFKILISKLPQFPLFNDKVSEIILKNIEEQSKDIFINYCFKRAILNKDKGLTEYFINKLKVLDDDALFDAVQTGDINIVNLILNKNSQPYFINQNKKCGTALNLSVKNNNLLIVKRLLSVPGIDPSIYHYNNKTPLIEAISNLNIEIMNEILDFYGSDIKSQSQQLDAAIVLLLEKLTEVKKETNSHQQQNNGCFSFCNKASHPVARVCNSPHKNVNEKEEIDFEKYWAVLRRISIIDSINLNHYVNNYSFLSYACEKNKIDIVKMLVQNEKVDINSYTPSNGNTPLLIAIINRRIEIAKILIQCERTNINQRNYLDETPLLLSAKNNLVELVELIINDKRFDPIKSKLNFVFYQSNDEIAKKLITVENLDVNYQHVETSTTSNTTQKSNPKRKITHFSDSSLYVKTPLFLAVTNHKNELIDMIINHQSFDPIKSKIKGAIIYLCRSNNIATFEKLLKFINDVNIVDGSGSSLLEIAIQTDNKSMVTDILYNESFDSKKSNFLESFVFSLTKCHKPSLKIIRELINYDSKHDHLINFKKCLPNRKSFFTILSPYMPNLSHVINILLQNGADLNMPDNNGIYPLEYAINSYNKEFVNYLVETGQIDFDVKLNKYGETYLHLAAANSNTEILSIFLENKDIDINSTDLDGETPLMYACRCGNEKNVQMIFGDNNLDYLHRNNDGDDALKISNNVFNTNRLYKSGSKAEYLNALLAIFRSRSRKDDTLAWEKKDEKMALRKKYEFEIMKMLDHPNVLKAQNIIFDDKNNPSILFEECPFNLNQVIQNKKLSKVQLVYSIYQIAEGMKYIHSCKIMHLNLKPSNILISDDGIIKISDFKNAQKVTPENEIKETEDVYSFGKIVYFILSGSEINNSDKKVVFESFSLLAQQLIDACFFDDLESKPTFEMICNVLIENNFDLISLSQQEIEEVSMLISQYIENN